MTKLLFLEGQGHLGQKQLSGGSTETFHLQTVQSSQPVLTLILVSTPSHDYKIIRVVHILSHWSIGVFRSEYVDTVVTTHEF